MHALIIEDEPLIAIQIEDHLRDLGYKSFDVAVTQEQAVEAAQKRCPDLITADMRLPEGSGVDAVQAICSDKWIPVVFITGTWWEVRDRIEDAVIVNKPFHRAELAKAVAMSMGAL